MSTTASISANIPKELSDMLDRVVMAEERSKSYYIKKGLEKVLRDRLEDLEDYEDAKQAYDDFVASGEKGVPFEDIKKELNL
jgi:predicted DNA-binding protein